MEHDGCCFLKGDEQPPGGMGSEEKMKERENDNLTSIQEYIDKKSKVSSLDTALLFFSSSVSILFTLISTLFGKSVLLLFLPTLFLGWFMPVYTGFIRGSLILDLIEERVRGWIYLIQGAGLYVSYAILKSTLPGLSPILSSILAIFATYVIARIILPKTLKIFGQESTAKIDRSYCLTAYSAIYMFLCFAFLINLEPFLIFMNTQSIITGRYSIVLSGIIMFFFAFGAIYSEFEARRELSESKTANI